MPSIRRYLANRGLRIFPAYIVIFLLVLAAGALSIHGNTVHYVRADVGRISEPSVFVPNIFLVELKLVPHANGTGIIPAWSLTAELTFYALLPLVGYLAWYLAKRVKKVVALAAGPILFLVVGLVTTYFVDHNQRPHGSGAIFRYDWGTLHGPQCWSAVSWPTPISSLGACSPCLPAIGLLRQHDKMPLLARGTKALSLVFIVAVALAARHNDRGYAISVVGICAAALIFLTVLPSHDGDRVNGLAQCLNGDRSAMWA